MITEQIVLLTFLIIGLAATLYLYFLKAKKQIQYRGDERWQLIQLNASNAANLSHWILLVLLAVLPFFIDEQTTFTCNRLITFALIYIGVRNFIELAATIYFDRQL